MLAFKLAGYRLYGKTGQALAPAVNLRQPPGN